MQAAAGHGSEFSFVNLYLWGDLEEVMNISDRIIVFYEGEIVADVRPEEVTVNELGLYMSGSKRKGAVK